MFIYQRVIIDHITPYWDIGMIGHQELADHGDPIRKNRSSAKDSKALKRSFLGGPATSKDP
jgi:hypothetical protein